MADYLRYLIIANTVRVILSSYALFVRVITQITREI